MHIDRILLRPVQPGGIAAAQDLFRSISRYLSGAFVIPAAKLEASSVAQRNNLFMLAEQVIAYGVEGDLVEFGCHDGSTAVPIAMALQQHGSRRKLHLYDDFSFDPKDSGLVRLNLERRFQDAEIPLPSIHEGEILNALHDDLPEKIAYAHIDLGFEEEPRQVARMVRRCLDAIYPRLSPGAVCVLNDYHDPLLTVKGWDCSPGVKMACDRFLFDKPEKVSVLFGEEYSHAFFRKV